MAIVINEQPSLWRPTDGDDSDSLAGDGSALHSMLLHDLVRGNNNKATYQEPCFQLMMDASFNTSTSAGRTMFRRHTVDAPDAGLAFLAQAPVIIPVSAKRLLWTAGINRYPAGGPDVGPVSLNVTSMTLFLSTNPLASLYESTQYPSSDPVHPYDLRGTISNTIAYGPNPNVQHAVSVSASGDTSADSYTLITDTVTGWENFYSGGIVDTSTGGAPNAYLIVAASYNSAAIAESIFLRDFSIWGVYE